MYEFDWMVDFYGNQEYICIYRPGIIFYTVSLKKSFLQIHFMMVFL